MGRSTLPLILSRFKRNPDFYEIIYFFYFIVSGAHTTNSDRFDRFGTKSQQYFASIFVTPIGLYSLWFIAQP